MKKLWRKLFPEWQVIARAEVYVYYVDYLVAMGHDSSERYVTHDWDSIPKNAESWHTEYVLFMVRGNKRKIRGSSKNLTTNEISHWLHGFTDLPDCAEPWPKTK